MSIMTADEVRTRYGFTVDEVAEAFDVPVEMIEPPSEPFGLDKVEDWAEHITRLYGSDEWMDLIDVDRLDLYDCDNCVLGQLFHRSTGPASAYSRGQSRISTDSEHNAFGSVFASNIYLDAWKLVLS